MLQVWSAGGPRHAAIVDMIGASNPDLADAGSIRHVETTLAPIATSKSWTLNRWTFSPSVVAITQARI